MAEEFKIKTKVDLDDSDARAKLLKLKNEGNDTPLKLKVKIDDLSKFQNQLKQINGLMNKAFKLDSKALGDLKQLESTIKEINKLSKKSQDGILGVKEDSTQRDLLAQYRIISSTIDKLKSQMNKGLGDIGAEKTLSQIKDLEGQLSKIKSSLTDTSKVDLIDFTRANKDTVEFNKNLSKIENTVSQLDGKINSVSFNNLSTDKIQHLKNELTELKKQLSGDLRLDIDVGNVQNRLRDVKQEINNLEKVESLASSFNKVESSIQQAFGQSVVDKFRSELLQLESTASSLDGSFIRAFSGLDSEIKNSISQVKRLGDETKRVDGFFGDFASSVTAYSLGDIIGDTVIDSIRGFKDTILELDDAMTNMKKVADASDIATPRQLSSIKNEAIEVSKQVGMTTQDVMNGIASSLQAGMGSMEESIKVARGAMILANTGDMGAEEASKGLNTIINAFKVDPLKEMQVQVGNTMQKTNQLTDSMDKLNHASNNYAITTKDLIDGFSNGGAVLANYGVSISDATAMMTAANLSIQDGSRVGNGLKSISVNLAAMKVNAREGTMELNKTAKGLSEIAGIEVYSDKSKGEIKDMVTILDEVRSKWGQLRDDEKNALSEAIAGKQQATVFQSLMQNYDTFKQIRDEFSQGIQFGSSEAENSQYIDSIAGRLNHLKAVWTSIGTTIVNSDFIKGMLDGFISLSEGIDTVVQAFDKLGLASSAAFGLVGGLFSALKTSITSSKSMAKNTSEVATSMANTTKATSKLSGELSTSTGFFKNFIKQGLLIGGVTIAVQTLAKAWEYAKDNLKNTSEELKALESQQLSEISANKEKISVLETIGKEYEDLASKANKSTEEQAKMLELGNELARVLPEIQIGTDSDGNAIISMTSDMQGYINKTNEAIAAQERLLLATNRERAENSIKRDSKGELLDRITGKGGLDEQALTEQKKYNEEWTRLEQEKIRTMNQFRNADAEGREYALKQLQDINNAQLKLEGEHGNKLAEINTKRMEGIDDRRDYAESLVKTGIDAITNATPEMKSAATEFVNSLDFSQIDDDVDLSNMQRIFSELPQMMSEGKFNIDAVRDSMSKINEEYSKTGNVENYNSKMQELAKTISEQTGWDVDTLTNMLTRMDNTFLKSKGTLEDYLSSFGSNLTKLQNGDAVAKALQSQYDSIQNYITQISNMPDSIEKQTELVVDLKNDETLPSQIRDMVASMENAGMDSDAILSITAQAMIDWKDGGFDPNSLEFIRQGIESELMQNDNMTYEQAVEVSTDIVLALGTLDNESVLKEIDDNIGEKEVTKKINIEGNPEQVKEIEDSIKLLESRPDVNKKVQAVVDGQEELVIFKQIIENLPVNEEYTNKFIIDNAEALSKMESWKEVQEWINLQPREFRQKYGIDLEGAEEAKVEVEETKNTLDSIDDTEATVSVESEGADEVKSDIDSINEKAKELEEPKNLTINNGELQGSVDEFSKLIEYSTKLKDGEYQINFKSDTADAISQIENLKLAINNLSNQFAQIPSATITLNTSLAAQNLSGLIVRINQAKSAIDTLSSKDVKINTALSAQNLSGLILRVQQYTSAINGVTTKTVDIATATAAKNVSGLIAKINEYNGVNPKTLTFKTNASTVTSQINTLASSVRNVPTSKTIRFNISQSGSVPSASSFTRDSLVSPISDFGSQIQSDTLGIQRNIREGLDAATSSIPTTLSTPRATIKTPIAISGNDIQNAMKYSINLLKELEARLESVGNEISILDKKMKHATNSEKLKYLEEQNKLYQENISVLSEQSDALQRQKNYYEYFLKNKGFTFNIDGNMTNYEEKLLAMEKEKERLDKLAEDKQKASSDYSGKDDKKKDSLSKAYDEAKKKADEYGESLTEIKKYADEYYKVAFTELPNVTEEFIDINNAIKDNINSIKEFELEIKKLKEDSRYKDENRDVSEVQNKLDKNQIELETAVGKERERLLKERIELQKQLKKETQDLLDLENQRKEGLKGELGQYGFTFREDGSIEGYGQKIEELKNSLTEDEFDKVFSMVEDYIDTTYDKIPDLENELLEMGNTIKDTISDLENVKIEQIDRDIERADEDELLGLLQEKKKLQDELVDKKQEYIDLLKKESEELANTLSEQGINFDSEGNMLNYEQKIKELQDALNNTSNAKEKEKIKKELEELIKNSEKYVKVTESEIPKAVEEWKDAQHAVKETSKEIEDIEKAQAKFAEDKAKAVRKATEDIMKVTQDLLQTQMNINRKQIDMLEKSMKLASFDVTGSYEALEKQISLLEKQIDLQTQMNKEIDKQKDYYKNRLVSFGIEFDDKGIATNAEKVLDKIKKQMANASDADELDKLEEKFNDIVDVLGDYNSALESIVDGQGNLMDLQLEIQGVYENMLETTKKIEDKITSILEKQVEERKKLIDEELKKRLDAINKEKDAYNEKRKEDKYQKEYDEKLKELSDIQAKIEAVSKDTSLAGQKKLAELLEEFNKKQEEFDEMVQDKLDEEINSAFDKESDRIQEEADKAKEDLDSKLEKEELYETIKDALESGKLQNIDGTVTDLKDALIEYENKYGDGLSVIGGLIKKDLLSQLDISLDTMKNIEKILKNLNISDFYNASTMSIQYPNLDSNSYSTVSNRTVQFNESLITVQGNVTSDVMPDLKKALEDAERRITTNIINAM